MNINFPIKIFFPLAIIVSGVIIYYLTAGLRANKPDLLMPLDDTYIHFQYARQMASGDPYVYNPGDEPTSGATSFLYTPLLAIGYLIGFQDLALAYWAVGIGALCFLLSTWLIYQIILSPLPIYGEGVGGGVNWIAFLLAVSFALTGAFIWSAVSGMETALFMLMPLVSLYAYQVGWQKYAICAGVLAALSRPEGAIIAISLVVALLWQNRRPSDLIRGFSPLLYMLPIIAIFVQPTVNFLYTGSFTASGNLAKSHLYNVTIPFNERLTISAQSWLRIWRELLTGYSEVDPPYVFPLITWLALGYVIFSLRVSWQRREITAGLLAGCWLLLISGAIATLDTAFWQFKRYQLPIMALMYPLAGLALIELGAFLRSKGVSRNASTKLLPIGIGIVSLLWTLPTTIQYARLYEENITVLRDQQMAMANWVNENLPPDARIAVHDVGVMRYVGNRTTYDVVGLTTPGAAASWRQGSGAIYETMHNASPQPDYFAIYPDIAGIPYLIEAGILGEELARFEVNLPEHTAVSASGMQIVTRANLISEEDLPQPLPEAFPIATRHLMLEIDVANLESEAAADYKWWNKDDISGFATEVRNLPLAVCSVEPCTRLDSGRLLNGGEKFEIPFPPASGQGYYVIGRFHAASTAVLKVGCHDDKTIYIIPAIPGQWIEITFGEASGSRFCIESEGSYYPAHYWVYMAHPNFQPVAVSETQFSVPDIPDVQLLLTEFSLERRENALIINTDWAVNGDFQRDGKLFIHLYADPDQPPIAGIDVYPIDGTLTPANWLQGFTYHDQTVLSLEGIPPGIYTLAIGFYEPASGMRFPVTSDIYATDGERLFLGKIEVLPE